MSNARDTLSSLNRVMRRKGAEIVRDTEHPGYVVFRDKANHAVLFQVCASDLFNKDGNRFQDDLP